MFVHLAIVIAMGAIAAGVIYAIGRTVSWKPPGIAYLLAVAAAMLGYAVYDEYSWYNRATAALPTQIKVIRSYATSMPYQPWTYAAPRIYKFDAVDLASPRANPKAPGLTLVRLIRVTRNTSSLDLGAIVDCGNERFAEVAATTQFSDDGVPLDAKWQQLTDHPALRSAICSGVAQG